MEQMIYFKFIAGILLLALGLYSFLVFLASVSGHPPTTAIGVNILGVSFFGGVVLIGFAVALFVKGFKSIKGK